MLAGSRVQSSLKRLGVVGLTITLGAKGGDIDHVGLAKGQGGRQGCNQGWDHEIRIGSWNARPVLLRLVLRLTAIAGHCPFTYAGKA